MDHEFTKLKRAITTNNSDIVESESNRIAELRLNEFLNKIKLKNWSVAYTQFSPSQYRYAFDKYEKFF
jgi:hypothetical protein